MSSALRNLILLAVVSTLAVMAGCAKKQKGPPAPSAIAADTIYVGGDIVTISDAQPTAEALAVKDGKVLAVGARVDIEKAHKGTVTQVVDLGGDGRQECVLPPITCVDSSDCSPRTVCASPRTGGAPTCVGGAAM